jgi:nuclear pore complex protein Nup205
VLSVCVLLFAVSADSFVCCFIVIIFAACYQVMRILEEGIGHFDTYTAFPGRPGLEQATLLCLRMVVSAAEKQEAMETYIRNTASSLMITSMERLLLSINPKTRRPDYLVTVAK